MAEEIKASGGSAVAAQVDVRNVESINKLIEKVIADNGRIDALIYNAGRGGFSKIT